MEYFGVMVVRRVGISNSIGFSAFQVSENSFECCNMLSGGICSVRSKTVDSESNVGSSGISKEL